MRRIRRSIRRWSLAAAVTTACLVPVMATRAGANTTGSPHWMVSANGIVWSVGGAPNYGSLPTRPNSPIVGITPTPSRQGYWLVAADGGVFSFGDAGYFGSMGGNPLNRPIVGMAPTASGHGYWLFAGDGGIFAFGDATFHGS